MITNVPETRVPMAKSNILVWYKASAYKNHIVSLISIAVTLAIWEWYGRGVDPIFFSYPTAIVEAVPVLVARGELQAALLTSLSELMVGFVAATVAGILLGLLMGRYRLLDSILSIQINALYSTPNVALIPLLILWFWLWFKAKVAIIFLAAFFPIIVNTYSGVRNVSGLFVEVVRAEGANEPQIFTRVVIPASFPFIMTGIRLAVGRGIVGMVVAEMFTATDGLGGAIISYGNAYATDKLFVIIAVLALFGVTLTEAVKYMESHFAQWKMTERAN
jgi:ABC-type nitrate/sulfonate/bicarbonate transport system permease component